MTRSIWKFQLPDDAESIVRMPKGTQVLSVQAQYGVPTVWALVDTQAELVRRRFWIVGTGWTPLNDGLGTFVGTVQLADGELVFHVFDAGEVMPHKSQGDAGGKA